MDLPLLPGVPSFRRGPSHGCDQKDESRVPELRGVRHPGEWRCAHRLAGLRKVVHGSSVHLCALTSPYPDFLKLIVSAFLQFHRCERQENSHRMPTIALFSTQTLSSAASISSLPMTPVTPWDVASIPAPLLQAPTRALLANPVAHLHPRP